jgi:hypothetical protein
MSFLIAACTNLTIGVNHQWPNPTISVNVGDQIIVNVVNELGNETIGIHFHGQYQTGTNTMDGPQGVNQCPILPGESFTYNFTVSGNHRGRNVDADYARRTLLVPFGITAITKVNIRMDSVAL